MKSLHDQIQELHYIPHPRSSKGPGSLATRSADDQRSARWKYVSALLWTILLEIAELELVVIHNESVLTRVVSLRRQQAELFSYRETLKTEYWR